MRELRLTVPRRHVEAVLDRLLPILPGGVLEIPAGRRIELRMRGEALPSAESLAVAAGRWAGTLTEHEVSDDWRRRRAEDYEPDVIGGRLVVAPDWAPSAAGVQMEIVLGHGAAFGTGTHPTTRACLELLLDAPVRGAFADLGCGTGVLAILAARLGWAPVTALDVLAASVSAASANALRNGVEVDVRAADLAEAALPAVAGFAANVPAPVHARIAAALREPLPIWALLSGFEPDVADAVCADYATRGLRAHRRLERGGWSVVVLERD